MNAKAQKEANAANSADAALNRNDTLRQNAITNKANAKVLALNEQQQGFNQTEARLNRKERLDKTTRDQLQHAADNFTQILNDQNVLTQNRMSPIMSRGK